MAPLYMCTHNTIPYMYMYVPYDLGIQNYKHESQDAKSVKDAVTYQWPPF